MKMVWKNMGTNEKVGMEDERERELKNEQEKNEA